MRQICPRIAVAVIAWTLFAGLARGALVWSSTKIKGTADAGQQSFAAVFTFKNTGDKPVRLNSIKTSCGCTTATAGKTVYAPGETGELKAKIDLRGHIGHLEKMITVTTDDAPHSPVTLTLDVTVPSIVDVLPRLLLWSRNGKAEPKEVTITAGGTIEVQLSNVVCGNPQFIIEQIADSPGRRYRLRVTPRSTDSPLRTFIQLTFQTTLDHAKGTAVNSMVYMIVQ